MFIILFFGENSPVSLYAFKQILLYFDRLGSNGEWKQAMRASKTICGHLIDVVEGGKSLQYTGYFVKQLFREQRGMIIVGVLLSYYSLNVVTPVDGIGKM